MDLNNVSRILKKINRLYELVDDIGEASKTEKDLLKAYVLDLYDAVIQTDSDEDLEVEEMKKKIKKQKKLEKKMKKQKVVEEVEEEVEEIEEVETPSEPEEVKGEESFDQVNYDDDIIKVGEKTVPLIDSAIADLFVLEDNKEISSKLAQAPVADLTKAMSINEKMFTINELFEGNADEMNNLLVALNGLGNFDEAKSVLARSVATKYKWGEASKIKKAKNFIKLVQRRYN